MKVIIKNSDGTYYASKVFGIINDKNCSGWHYKYVVFDKKGENLVIRNEYKKTDHEILTFDADKSDMKLDDNFIGKVNFLSDEEYKKILNNKTTPDIIEKCKKYITHYKDDFIDITSEKDINNVMEVFFGFHDSYVSEIKEKKEELTVYFHSPWGCDLEIVFIGNTKYDMPWPNYEFLNASLTLKDAYVALIDYGETDEALCYFKGNKAKYRIIRTFNKHNDFTK